MTTPQSRGNANVHAIVADDHRHGIAHIESRGITLREHFAALNCAAMASGVLAAPQANLVALNVMAENAEVTADQAIVVLAVRMADALIAELAK